MKQELEKIAREFDIPIADPYGLLALGAFLGQREEEKNKELGIYALKEFLKSKPDSPSGWHNLGVIYLSMGDAEKALGYLQKAYKLASGDHKTIVALANAYSELGKYKEALHYYDKALAHSPGYVSAWTNLGTCCFKQGDYPRAKEAYKKALTLDGNNHTATVGLAEIKVREQMKEKAQKIWQELKKKNPVSQEDLALTFITFFRENLLEKAAKVLAIMGGSWLDPRDNSLYQLKGDTISVEFVKE